MKNICKSSCASNAILKKIKILRQLENEAKACKRCRLNKTRTNVVFGTGSINAKIMLIGESPGFFENQRGVPFVGAAGKNLNALLLEAGVRRGDVYICNLLKCRPPKNRDPLPDEVEACRPLLQAQIPVIKPKFIIALGRIAARELLGRYVSMGKEHGTLTDCSYAGVDFKLFITYHPAAAIYSAETKARLQADFRKLGRILRSLQGSA